MSDSPSFLVASGAPPQRARFPAHGARALRAEIEATEDKSLLAFLHHELGRIYLTAGDLTAAARSALEAHQLRPDLIEPLEALITIAHLKGSSSQLPMLLGELARDRSDPDQALRATFEFLAALLVHSEQPEAEASQVRSIVDPMLESGPESAAVWLLAEIAAALIGNREARARAILGRVGTAQTPEVRGSLLERAATVYQEAGNFEAARAALFQAKDEFPHRGLFRRIEALSEAEGDWATAAFAALEESALCEGAELAVPLLRRALWLRRGGQTSESLDVLRELDALLPGDLGGPLLLAAFEKQEQNLAAFFDHLGRAVPLAAPHDQEIFSLALLHASATEIREAAWQFVEPRLGHSQIALGVRLWFALTQNPTDEALHSAIIRALRVTEPTGPALERTIEFLETRVGRDRGETGLGPRLDDETLERILKGNTLPGLLFRAYLREGAPGSLVDANLAELPTDLARIVALVRQDHLLRAPETRAEGMLELRALLAQDPGDLTSTIALARALEDKPDEAAFLLIRAAESTSDPKLGAVLFIWAGLALAGAGKSERGKRVLALAERVLPGSLGAAAPYVTSQGFDGVEPRGSGATAALLQRALGVISGTEGEPSWTLNSPEVEVFDFLEQLAVGDGWADPEKLGLSHFDHAIISWGNAFDSDSPATHAVDGNVGSGPIATVLEAIWGMKTGRTRNRSDEDHLRSLLGPSQAEPWFLAEEELESGRVLEGLSIIEGALGTSDASESGLASATRSQEQSTVRLLKAYHILAAQSASGEDGLLKEALDILLSLKEELGEDETYLLALLASAEGLGLVDLELETLEKLALLREDTPDAAELWERAGVLRLDRTPDQSETDRALERALEIDPDRELSFRSGFERARVRADGEAELRFLDLRARGSLAPARRARLFWEKARVARRIRRQGAELDALGALAQNEQYQIPVRGRLAQIHLRDGRLRDAAECLSELATDPRLPGPFLTPILSQAVALFDELSEASRSLRLLESIPRERRPDWFQEELGRISAKAGRYELAFSVFAELNDECDDIPKRLHFARLMLAIARDHLHDSKRSSEATRRVLRDAPTDRDAVDAALTLGFSNLEKRAFLAPSLQQTKQDLLARPLDAGLVHRYVELAAGGGDEEEVIRARGLGRLLGARLPDPEPFSGRPSGNLLREDLDLLAPPDLGETERRFLSLIGRRIAPLTQPDLASLDLSYLLASSSSQDSPAFEEIRPWAHAFGASRIEVIVGGRDPSAWFLIQADPPIFVIGGAIPWPLSERRVARLAAELVSAEDASLGFLAMARDEATSWLDALLAGDGTSDPEAHEKRALIREQAEGAEWTNMERLSEELRSRGVTSQKLLIAIASRALRASLVAVGHAGALVHMQDLLPEEESCRRRVLGEAVQFALGPEVNRLRRKVGLS